METDPVIPKEMAVLIGSNDENVSKAIQMGIYAGFRDRYDLRFSRKNGYREIRNAISLYDFELVILSINTMLPPGYGGSPNLFEEALDLLRHLKSTRRAAVILLTSRWPPGFATRVEQEGVDAMLDNPYEFSLLTDAVTMALESRKARMEAEAKASKAQQKRERLRPRVVILDDCTPVREAFSLFVWHIWPNATVIATGDSVSAWAELQREAPDLFITDLSHDGYDGCELLRRLSEARAKYPVMVISAGLPGREAEARAAAGPHVRVSFWPKPILADEFIGHLAELSESLSEDE